MATTHILQVITDNDLRGGQVFASDLHAALEQLGESVRTVALAPASRDRALDFEVLGPSRRHPATLMALRRAIAGSAVAVAHGSTTLPMCALAVRGLPTPFVYRQISEQRFWANTPSRRLRTRIALRAASHVTALWRGAADALVSDFGVAPGDITIIPNGVPEERCPQVDEAARTLARERFGLVPDRPTLLSIGALAPEKGVDILVRAMGYPELADWQMLVVGDGSERERLERLAHDQEGGVVVFHESVPSGAEAIAAADVVGLTSRGGDSMPAVLIEAGMMGLPSVATPVEGIVDIVLDGRTGRIVPRDDAAATASAIVEVGEEAERMGRAARQHCIDSFEIRAVARRWRDVLHGTCLE